MNKAQIARRQHCYLYISGFGIPPMAIGGSLKSDLHQRAQVSWNPPDGNRGMVKVQPFTSLSQPAAEDDRQDFNDPPIAIGGI
jgi:hypothetical protein